MQFSDLTPIFPPATPRCLAPVPRGSLPSTRPSKAFFQRREKRHVRKDTLSSRKGGQAPAGVGRTGRLGCTTPSTVHLSQVILSSCLQFPHL